jgi:hypothetical protein
VPIAGIKQLVRRDSLRARAVKGGAWLGTSSVAEQASRFARNIILTRLLAPGAFGAMAIVLSTSALVVSLSDVGIGHAVIQNPPRRRGQLPQRRLVDELRAGSLHLCYGVCRSTLDHPFLRNRESIPIASGNLTRSGLLNA